MSSQRTFADVLPMMPAKPNVLPAASTLHRTLAAGLCLLAGLGVYTPGHAAEEDDWFFRDFEAEARAVNEGQLEFLAEPPAQQVHHHQNHLVIREPSLQDGWVGLEQCHDNLDAVPDLEVIYSPDRIRNLKVVSARNIGRAWVEGPSVQLQDVQHDARLCVSAESRALQVNGDGAYVLRNGPFMRRFLDGYYPMRVVLQVDYPCGMLDLVAASPADQPGFHVEESDCSVGYDTWFEGRLSTELVFQRNGG